MTTQSDVALAIAFRSRSLGRGVTEEELRQWLSKIGKSIDEFLEIAAATATAEAAYEEKPIPDQKSDPEGFAQWERWTSAQGAKKAKGG